MGDADGKRSLGAEYLAPACTTHFSAVDRDGNMAAVTQTLLSTFGSKFVTPNTGLTMNNGIMWFDPVQGNPNSLAPGKRCLTNYTPVVAEAADGRRLAAGASGGRRILPAELRDARILRLELPQGRFERRIALPTGRYTISRFAAHGCVGLRLGKSS